MKPITSPAPSCTSNPIKAISYAGYRYPQQVISYAVWLYFPFPLNLRMVEEILAQRGINVTYETVRCWALALGQRAAKNICQSANMLIVCANIAILTHCVILCGRFVVQKVGSICGAASSANVASHSQIRANIPGGIRLAIGAHAHRARRSHPT